MAYELMIAKTDPGHVFPSFRPGSAEWASWERYFREHLRREPWALKAARSGEIKAMQVPTQWPEWFDASFSSVPHG